MEKIFEPGLKEQIEVLKKELDLERECSQAGYLENQKLSKHNQELQDNSDKVRKENNDLYNKIAKLIDNHKKEVKNLKWIKDHDYIFLVDENKKLRQEVRELKAGNKKLTQEIDDRIVRARKAGM